METDEVALTKPEVAAMLNISLSTVGRLMKDKKNPIPYKKISSRTIRFVRQDVVSWLARQAWEGKE